MAKSYDYKLKLKRLNEVNKRRTKKIVATTAISSALVLSTAPVPLGSLVSNSDYTVEAASLAEVQLLTNVSLDTNLTESDGSYNLNLNLTGSGDTSIELVNPDKTAVFWGTYKIRVKYTVRHRNKKCNVAKAAFL